MLRSLPLSSASNIPTRSVRPSRRHILTKSQLEPERVWNPDLPKGPRKSAKLAPSFLLTREDAVVAQLKALMHNNFPTNDHGIEVMYRFAGFDPWERSTYFGGPGSRALDLGQFERFRRLFYTSCYTTLLNHTEHEFLSSLEVDEGVWKSRVLVKNGYRKEENTYEFTMTQRFGGKYDGVWYCTQLTCDGCCDSNLYGII